MNTRNGLVSNVCLFLSLFFRNNQSFFFPTWSHICDADSSVFSAISGIRAKPLVLFFFVC
eukprot:NODE_5600_length_499_cov_63.260000_g4186_i0.p4 GENE.NODE_5600_length_499_cov_63.260000_g4186_i0~~NODE_5600_length_499_cov_63.260000_g4186_i0.p4  ORF type:complete len:60 (+),score=1.04 NODE_5600_length_499_cov_63.260000_g4186_i0:208-387(+)